MEHEKTTPGNSLSSSSSRACTSSASSIGGCAWTTRRGALAPEAAGEIHSDFTKHFIRAEVIPFETYIKVGGETNAKTQGLMQVEGKEYEVEDGDVMHFRVGG